MVEVAVREKDGARSDVEPGDEADDLRGLVAGIHDDRLGTTHQHEAVGLQRAERDGAYGEILGHAASDGRGRQTRVRYQTC